MDPLAERVDGLTTRNGALEAEVRELRNQFRAQRIRDEVLPRRCPDCGYTAIRCQCEELRRVMRRGDDGRRRRSLTGYGYGYRSGDGDGDMRFDGARDISFEVRAPRPGRGRGVRWVDEVDEWD